MACLEIHYNNKLVRIKNNEDSEFSKSSEFSILFNFLTKGILPENTTIEGDLNVSRDELFDTLLNAIINNPDNNGLLRNVLPNLENYENFVDKLIGNHSLKEYSEYINNEFDYNVLINSSWGESKNWYGFTNNRMVLVAGSLNNISSIKTGLLTQAYNNIKLGEEWTINVIKELANKYNLDKEWNIWKILTWLANNVNELIPILSMKYERAVDMKRISKDDIIGLYFNHDSQSYFITGFSKTDPNSIEAININTNEKIDYKIKNIRRLYSSVSIEKSGKTYRLINKEWYRVLKNKLNKVDDNLSKSLSNEYLSISNDDNIIDVFSDNINGYTTIDNANIKDLLPDGARVKTASNIYVKKDGVFEGLSDNEKWYNIIYNNENDILNILHKKNINDEDKILSPSDMKIILYDVFNIGDNHISFDDISFSYKKNAPAVTISSRKITTDEGVSIKPYIRISSNFINNEDNVDLLKLAIGTVYYINSGQNKNANIVSNIEKFWENILKAYIDGGDIVDEDIINILNKMDDDTTKDSINEALTNNINDMHKDIDVDNLMKDILDKGIMLISCSINGVHN